MKNKLRKEIAPNGRIRLFIGDKRIFSFKSPKIFCKFNRIYARRFKGLKDEEIKYCLEQMFKLNLGYTPNLDHPKTFNEKLTWEKLYYRNPLMTTCADKVCAREYFLQKVPNGEPYLVKQLGVYNSPDEIDYNTLPNQFVLKSNWGSGCQIIVRDKSQFNAEKANKEMAHWMKKEANHYFALFETGYKDIIPKIVVEELLDFEYKLEFFCFNGQPKFYWVVLNDKTEQVQANFYDLKGHNLGIFNYYPNFSPDVPQPPYFKEMEKMAKALCGDFPFVRCDFYKTKDSFRFSEMTFFHWGCSQAFDPPEWDLKLGDMLELPLKKDRFYITDYSEKYYKDYNTDTEVKRPLKVEEIEDGTILPAKEVPLGLNNVCYQGGVLDKNRNFIVASATLRNNPEKALESAYEIDEEPEYCDETVIYGGVLYEFYGHVLLESMARLWYYIKSNPQHYRVVMDVVPRARGKFKEFFELLDIPYDEKTFITKPTRYKKVIIPEQASIYATNWHKDYLIPFEYMRSKVKAKKYDKVYFTRIKLRRNPVLNEQAIVKIFKQNGYKIVAPETLSLKEQIAYLKGAKSFACWAGTLACQVLFCENGVERIILNRALEPAEAHHIFDSAKQLKTYYVDCALNLLPVSHVHGPWVVGYTQELNDFCVDKGFKHPKSRYINKVPYKYVGRFYKHWQLSCNLYPFTYEEAVLCAKRVKLKKGFIHKLCKILSINI